MNRRTFLARTFGALAAAAVLPKIAAADEGPLAFAPDAFEKVGAGFAANPETFEVGDVITIGGRYTINPMTRKPSEFLQQYVVTAVYDDGRAHGEPMLAIHPAILDKIEYVEMRGDGKSGRHGFVNYIFQVPARLARPLRWPMTASGPAHGCRVSSA